MDRTHSIYRNTRRCRTSTGVVAAVVRAPARLGALAFGDGVAGGRRDRPAGVGVEPVRVLPVASRLRVWRRRVVWFAAGAAVSVVVAWAAWPLVAGAGALAPHVYRPAVRVAVGGVGVPADTRLVLEPEPDASWGT